MHRTTSSLRTLTGMALAIALLTAVGLVSGARAQPADNQLASITIYAAICPVGYTGTAFFDDCYDNPGTDITFILDQNLTATTGADGLTAFEGINQEGEYLLQIDVPGEFTDFAAFCSDEFGAAFPYVDASDQGGILLDLTLDDDIRCDFYIVPISGQGPPVTATAPAPAPAATSTVATLPRTGAGADGGGHGTFWPLTTALALVILAAVALRRGWIGRPAVSGNR